MSKHGITIDIDLPTGHRACNLKMADRLFSVNAKAEGDKRVAEMLMYDFIGENWMGDGLTAKRVEQALADLGQVDELTVLINTPGGVIYEALGIYNALVRCNASVITHNVGAAWSCGSWLLQAGDERWASENSTTMLHNSQGMAMGDRRVFEKEIEVLDKMDATIASTFAKRTGRKPETFRNLMNEESWFTGQEALDAKLVDRMVPAKSAAKNALDPKAYGFNGKNIGGLLAGDHGKLPLDAYEQRRKTMRARLVEVETHG